MSDEMVLREDVPRLSSAYQSWYRFSRNPTAMIGLVIVSVCVLAALLAPWVTPYPDHIGAEFGCGTARHGYGNVFTHGATIDERIFRNVKALHFHVVDIAHHAAAHHSRRPWHLGERCGDKTARAAFSRCDNG